MSDALDLPVSTKISEISSTFNSNFPLLFGLGMYTMIYFGAMYLYFTRNSSKRYIVPATITILFLCNIAQTGVQLYLTILQFIDNGGTRDSVFMEIFGGPQWVLVAIDVPSYIGFVLADGLLIWRCYFVWNRSLRIISLPLLLIITEIALFFVLLIIHGVYGPYFPNKAIFTRANELTFAAFFTSVGTSLVTTTLIAYRIYSASKQGVSKRRFKYVINIVVQSGAAYSLALLVSAITPVLLGGIDLKNPSSIALNIYITIIANVVAGISATILVARVSMLDTTTTFPSTSIHLSGLQFNLRSTHQANTPEGIEGTHPVGVNGSFEDNGLLAEDKVQ